MSAETAIADLTISAVSKQYIRVPVTAEADPTGDAISWAIIDQGQEPAPSDFVAGNWQTLAGTYYARVLVGPGSSLVLARGYYEMFVQITDNPEIPVLRAGVLEVTY